MIRNYWLVIALVFLVGICVADDDLTVLEAGDGGVMMTAYLNGLADEALEARRLEREALKTAEEIGAYQEKMRAFFVERLGGWPERTPLNARVVARETREGYRLEKIIYESRPNFFVTAGLFLPLSDGPYPGVLVPCGHSTNGKVNEVYQRACIFLAMNGIAALIYDPIGQGERYQILNDKGKPRFGSTMEHTFVGVGCILLGTNTATYRIWDGMRGIDYLVSRPDIDPERIGCTGNSGGGTLTSYLMALDLRIQCAAPSCYLTSFDRLLKTEGPQDAEQDIYGQIAHGMDHADYVMMRAPRPTLMCCATRDFFDITGTWDSFRQAKRLYTKLGFAERVDLVETDEQHGFSTYLRQGAVRWMRRWLSGIDDAVVEAEFPVLTDEELQCTPDGQVLLMDGARSTFDINVEMEQQLAPQRKTFWGNTPRKEALDKVRTVAGIRRLEDLPAAESEIVGKVKRKGYFIEKIVLRPEPGICLPALAFVPPKPDTTAYLYVNGLGKAIAAKEDGPIAALVQEGHIVFAPDLRGIGETQSTETNKGWTMVFGAGWKDYFRAYLLEKSYVGMRTEDILVCARFLASYRNEGKARRIVLTATGEAVASAIHAAALEPDLIASLELEKPMMSWAEIVGMPVTTNQLVNTVHGALRFYDLPDLLGTLSPDRL